MVHILANVGFEWVVSRLVARYGLERDLAVASYQAAITSRHVPAGTYVFADLDRVPARDWDDVLGLWDQIRRAGGTRLLNDPRRVRLRYALLRLLAERGLNDFNVFRADEDLAAVRFPAFVRCEHDHAGPRTGLLASRMELDRALDRLGRRHAFRGQLLVTEYAAAPERDGLFRKYGALIIGGRILPWHLIASRHWLVKGRARVLTETVKMEERRYLAENPHADALRRVFELAHVEYGRIDYGIVDGRIQVYEINTNPAIVGRGRTRNPNRTSKPPELVAAVVAAFRDLDRATPSGEPIALVPRRGRMGGWAYRILRRSQSAWSQYAHRSQWK